MTLHMWFPELKECKPDALIWSTLFWGLWLQEQTYSLLFSGLMDLRQPWYSQMISEHPEHHKACYVRDWKPCCPIHSCLLRIWYTTSFTLTEFCTINGSPFNRPTVLLWTIKSSVDKVSPFFFSTALALSYIVCICIIKKEKEAYSFLCVTHLMRKLTLAVNTYKHRGFSPRWVTNACFLVLLCFQAWCPSYKLNFTYLKCTIVRCLLEKRTDRDLIVGGHNVALGF